MRVQLFRSALISALLAIIGTIFLAAHAPLVLAATPAPGELDTTFARFGSAGVVTTSELRTITGLAVQPDGKMVVTGPTNTLHELAVFRYLPTGGLDPSFSDDGRAFFPDMFGVRDLALQSDGRIVVGGSGSAAFYLARLTPEGALDVSFDGDGWISDGDANFNLINAILVQSNGMIVTCGHARVGDDLDFGVVRYTPDGTRDMSFSDDGVVTIGFGGEDRCKDVVQQRDGKLVLAGERHQPGTFGDGGDFAVARLEINGTLDNDNGDGGFDGDGKLLTGFGDDEYGKAVVLQPDGKIVVLGDDDDPFDAPDTSFLARYLPDGKLDGTFDGDGKLSIPTAVLRVLALQPDGKIVVLGEHRSPDGDYKFALHRLLPDGKHDPSFDDGDGIAWLDFGGSDGGWAIALQPDGRILVGGHTHNTALLVRLWPDGTIDPGGKQTHSLAVPPIYDPGSDVITSALAVQPDGKLLVAGELRNPGGTISDAVVTRFLPNGLLDRSFGTSGTVRFDLGVFDVATAIVVQPDGKILIAGYSDFGDGWVEFLVARFLPTGAPDSSFGENNNNYRLANFSNGPSLDYGKALALAPDGKIVVAGDATLGTSSVWGVARWNADGTPDTSFDADGKAFVNFTATNAAKAVVVQPDGKLIVGGDYNGDFFIQRLLPNGERDVSYGINGGGYNVTDMGGADSITALALTPDGWLYAAGYGSQGGSSDFALALYRPDGTLAECQSGQACTHWPTGKRFVDISGSDTAFALVLRGDNQLVVAGCSDDHMAAAQVSTTDAAAQPLVFQTDFVGQLNCALGVQFSNASKNKIVLAGIQTSDADLNIALARFQITAEATKRDQTISFPPLPDRLVGETVTLSATASSGLPIEFASTTPAVCSLATPTSLTLHTSGICTVVAGQRGDGQWNPAADVTRSFVVRDAAKRDQTIAIEPDPLPAQLAQQQRLVLRATATSGLAVELVSSTPLTCATSGTTVIGEGAGTCRIAAIQAGSAVWNPARVELEFRVTATLAHRVFLPLTVR